MADVCRSCKAPIRWAVTGRGKKMPMDAEPTPAGNFILAPGDPPTALLIHDGDMVAKGAARFTSHFATCPDSKTFRRPR